LAEDQKDLRIYLMGELQKQDIKIIDAEHKQEKQTSQPE
jgi:hypothetical protein